VLYQNDFRIMVC